MIVLFEESPAVFHKYPGVYLHYGKTKFETDLPLELLQEFCLIALDVFCEIPYSKDEKSEQRAWLSRRSANTAQKTEELRSLGDAAVQAACDHQNAGNQDQKKEYRCRGIDV